MRISIVIPTYAMQGNGHKVIDYAFKSLYAQDFKDFEVIVSDQSQDYLTSNVCKEWLDELNIVYTREENKRGYFTANENNGIKNCSGEIIKFLDADDYLYSSHSLKFISDEFTDDVNWLATDYVHTYDRIHNINRHSPQMNDRIYVVNTIGTPSCVAVRNNKDLPLFDENLRWAGDCEWYKQLYDKYGNPKMLNIVTAVHLLWKGQVANTFATNELQEKENAYIINKYEGNK